MLLQQQSPCTLSHWVWFLCIKAFGFIAVTPRLSVVRLTLVGLFAAGAQCEDSFQPGEDMHGPTKLVMFAFLQPDTMEQVSGFGI